MNLDPRRAADKIKISGYPSLLFALGLTAAGCAPRSLVKIDERLRSGERDGCYLEGVPFVRQQKNWCGPAALASVFAFWGKEVSQQEIAREIFRPSVRGTLDFELEDYARRQGFWAKSYCGNLAFLEKKLSSGFPLVVLQKPHPFLRRYHYLVVIGYFRPEQVVIVHTGRKAAVLLPWRRFLRTWKPGDCWTLLICPPEKVVWELSAQGYNRLGIIYERQGKLESSVESYLKSISLQPDNPEYHFNLGNACRRQGRLRQAEDSYRKVIALSPEYADAYNNLAVVYLEENSRLEEAEECLEQALALNPEGGRYYWDTLGEVYLRRHRFSEAEAAFTRALELTPGEESQILAIIYEHLAQACRAQGKVREAELNFRKAESMIDEERKR